MWSVPPPAAADAASTHDVTKVQNTEALGDAIQMCLKAFPDALFHTLPYESPQLPKTHPDYTELVIRNQNNVGITDLYLLPALSVARLSKDEYEIGLIRKACDISSRAHETVMRVLGLAVKGKIDQQAVKDRPLLPGEWLIEKESEAEAIFVASCRREGSVFGKVSCPPTSPLIFSGQVYSSSLPSHLRSVHPGLYIALLLQRQGVRLGARRG